MSDPTLWQSIEPHIPTLGWMTLASCAVYCARLAWKARGYFDTYIGQQQKSHELVAKTLTEVEGTKKIALEAVEKAQTDGLEKANEILSQVGELNNNHLSHIEDGIREMVKLQEKHLVVADEMKTSLAILKDRGRE